jgi:addiction module RelE/StbE family toxin
MAANLRVEWSDRAAKDLDRIYNYLMNEWTEREANAFLDLVEEFESLVTNYPKAFIVSDQFKDCRLGLIHKNVTAIYKISQKKIFIVTLFENQTNSGYR